MKKLGYLFATFCLAIVGGLTACGTNDGLTHITIAEVTHSIFYAPQYVAMSQGFFEEEGLKVNIITTPGADKTMAALLSKEAQIGLMGPEASVYVYQNGQQDYAVNFAQLTQKDGSFILGRDPIENFDYTMMRGKTVIGGRKGGMPLMILEYILKNAGLDIGEDDPTKEVNVRTDVSFDAMSGVFVAGESDFVTAFEPTASQVVRSGKGHILASLGEDSGLIPYTCYSTLKSYMEKNEEILIKFNRAIQKGIDFVLTHTVEEIIPHLRSEFTSSDDEELTTVMTNYLGIEAWPSTLRFQQEGFDKLIDIVKMAGQLAQDAEVPYEKLVTNAYISQVKVAKELQIYEFVTFLFLCIFICIMLFFK